MAVLTKQQWYDKIKRFVPAWYFQDELNQKAHFMGLAKLMETLQQDVSDHFDETMIETADGEFLDEHGSERSITRKTAESDTDYRPRIRIFLNTVAYTNLKALIDDLIEAGNPCTLIENWNYGFADDTESDYFYDDPDAVWIEQKKSYNWLTFLIPSQPGDDTDIKAEIVELIEYNKALGVTYDILYGNDSLVTEDGDTLTTEDGDRIINESGG